MYIEMYLGHILLEIIYNSHTQILLKKYILMSFKSSQKLILETLVTDPHWILLGYVSSKNKDVSLIKKKKDITISKTHR